MTEKKDKVLLQGSLEMSLVFGGVELPGSQRKKGRQSVTVQQKQTS